MPACECMGASKCTHALRPRDIVYMLHLLSMQIQRLPPILSSLAHSMHNWAYP